MGPCLAVWSVLYLDRCTGQPICRFIQPFRHPVEGRSEGTQSHYSPLDRPCGTHSRQQWQAKGLSLPIYIYRVTAVPWQYQWLVAGGFIPPSTHWYMCVCVCVCVCVRVKTRDRPIWTIGRQKFSAKSLNQELCPRKSVARDTTAKRQHIMYL